MNKFNKAQAIAQAIANSFSVEQIQDELYQLFILHYKYEVAKGLSIECEVKDYESELRGLIMLLSESEIKEMELNIKNKEFKIKRKNYYIK